MVAPGWPVPSQHRTMLVLHAVWSLVGVPERSPGWANRRRGGGRPIPSRPRRLTSAVEALGITDATSTEMTLLLPGSRCRSRSSPTVVRLAPPRYPRGRPMLRPWTVPTVTIDPMVVLVTASTSADPVTGIGTDIVAGPSLAWWAALPAVALDLLAREPRVLPAVIAGGDARLEAAGCRF